MKDKLKKQLNLIGVFSIASGAMISSGIFILPSYAYKESGKAVIIAYLVAGLLMLPALFSQLELSTAIPKAGGTYFYSERILGSLAGVIAGFANWFSIALKGAFALVGISAFATLIFPTLTPWQLKIIALSACVFFTVLNLISVKSSINVQIIMVIFLVGILLSFFIVGYRKMDFTGIFTSFKFNWKAVLATTGMVFISYGGLTKVAGISEEVKNPQRNLLLGALLAFLVVQTLYILILFVILGILPHNSLISSNTPVSDTALHLFKNSIPSRIFMIATAIAAILAFITTANASIMTASRVPLAMGRDALVPKFLSLKTKKRQTPYISVLITGAFMAVIIAVLDIKDLAKVASLFMLLLFIFVNLEVVIIRFSGISNYKPSFKSPLFPFIQIAGIVIYIILIIGMGWKIIIISAGFIILAILWYFIYARKKANRKSVFIHMIEKLTKPDFKDEEEKELEAELLDILIDRDEIVEDRFDKLIRESEILDYNHTIDRKQLFLDVSEILSKKYNIERYKIEQMFEIREEMASTLIYPGVAVPHAVPHVIVDGDNIFDIILVRNKFGIKWTEDEIVYTAFAMIGSKDQRNFHLRALAAISQILMDGNFHSEWMNAKNKKELKSVIILSKRKRK